MSSRNQDFLAQYYGDAPQQASDYEKKPKRKKPVHAPAKVLSGFKMVDDTDFQDETEDDAYSLPLKSTHFGDA